MKLRIVGLSLTEREGVVGMGILHPGESGQRLHRTLHGDALETHEEDADMGHQGAGDAKPGVWKHMSGRGLICCVMEANEDAIRRGSQGGIPRRRIGSGWTLLGRGH
jgi:hypothetical protein